MIAVEALGSRLDSAVRNREDIGRRTGFQGVSPPASLLVRVYWRPGCPWCSILQHGLVRKGLPFEEINIWADPTAAAFVRSVAHGNETVPTVLVGGRALVNPSVRQVLRAVRDEDPEMADRLAEEGAPGPLSQLVGRLAIWRRATR